jgi:hypothetical protein
MPIPVMTILKLDPKLANLGLGKDIGNPLNDERCWLLLIWGSVTYRGKPEALAQFYVTLMGILNSKRIRELSSLLGFDNQKVE